MNTNTVNITAMDETRLEIVEDIARSLLKQVPSERVYHDISHTEYVVDMANRLGQEFGLDESELELLLASAWFHDIGYVDADDETHVERSIELVDEYLTSLYTQSELNTIKTAIRATEWPQTPENTLGRLLADADVANLGTDDFNQVSEQVFEEQQRIRSESIDRDEFDEVRLEMFSDHEYKTIIAREKFSAKKQENLQELRQSLD